MSVAGLEQTLRDLPTVGHRVKDRGYRQVWRFEHAGRAFYLKFYRRIGFRDAFRRTFRGSPAMLEFTRLQLLQKAGIPAPRGVAVLMGFRLMEAQGDAVVLEAIEPAVQLDRYFSEYELRGEQAPDRYGIALDLLQLVGQLASAGLGHEDLHLGNILRKDGKLYLLDGYAVRRGGLKLRHLFHLAHSVGRYATITDLLRGWRTLGPDKPLPIRNPVTADLVNTFISRRATSENRYFGKISAEGWSGFFFKQDKYPRRWSAASRLNVSGEDWDAALPELLRKLEGDELTVRKRSKSGDVVYASASIGGSEMELVIKRPRRRYWYRYVNEIGRGSRARRAWVKSWRMILRNFPSAWPLLLLEKRAAGYVTDSLIVFERVPGPTLARANLDAMPTEQRDGLLRRTGRLLRAIEREGFAHFDAKASNWIVRDDERLGPGPVLIDVDGIRYRKWVALGIKRLLKSMHENEHYSIADSYSLCKGYAPAAPLSVQEPEGELATPEESEDDPADGSTIHAAGDLPNHTG